MQESKDMEVVNSLRRDVDGLKESTDKISADIVCLKQESAGKVVEVEHLTTLINKIETTMNTLVDKIEKISINIATLNFYTRDEVDNKLKSATIELMKDIKELKEKPGRRFEKLQDTIVTALISGIVGFAISQLIK